MTTAWLIERPGPLYWNGRLPSRYGCDVWSTHDHAVRFTRKVDAEVVIRGLGLGDSAVAREHGWWNAEASRPATVRPAPSVAPAHDCAALGCSPSLGWHVMHGFNDVAAQRARALGRHYEPKVPAPERLGDAWPPGGFEVWL